MNTEITENYKGWLCYDGECALCRTWAGHSYRILRRHGFRLVALQVPWVKAKLGLKEGEPPDEMRLLLSNGRNFGGADALVQVAGVLWWAWPFYALAQLPGAMPLLRRLYRMLARRRHCLSGASCGLPRHCAEHHSITSAFYELP